MGDSKSEPVSNISLFLRTQGGLSRKVDASLSLPLFSHMPMKKEGRSANQPCAEKDCSFVAYVVFFRL